MKLPIEATVAGGYRFLFGRIVSILGTLWFPYVVLFGVGGLLLYSVLPHGMFHGDFSQVDETTLINPQVQAVRMLFSLLAWIIGAMVTVHLMRHALGLKESTTFIHFSLAAPVWRMAVALLLGGLIIAAMVIVMVIAGVAIVVLIASHPAKEQATAVGFGLGVICFFAIIYVAARLFFFLPAVVVAEEKIGLGRAWELGKGNFWRIVVVWLCIVIPIWIVVGIAMGAMIGSLILHLSHLPQNPTLEQVKPALWALLRLMPVILPVLIATGIAARGYMAGAVGAAYKAVTKEERA